MLDGVTFHDNLAWIRREMEAESSYMMEIIIVVVVKLCKVKQRLYYIILIIMPGTY